MHDLPSDVLAAVNSVISLEEEPSPSRESRRRELSPLIIEIIVRVALWSISSL